MALNKLNKEERKMKESQKRYEAQNVADCMVILFFLTTTSLSYVLICEQLVIKHWWFYVFFVAVAIVLWLLSFMPIILITGWLRNQKIYTNLGAGLKDVVNFIIALVLGFINSVLGLLFLFYYIYSLVFD